jgi:hypothetical protein
MKSLLKIVQPHQRSLLLLFATWGIYFIVLFTRMIQVKPDGFYVGHENLWSDWALHIGMANIFAYKDPQYWFAYHPMYAGGKLTYPFLTNLISGMLMRAGCSIYVAFIIPSIVYSLLLITGMYTLFYIVFKSQKQSIIAIFSFFLSSGMGFIGFLQGFFNHPTMAMWLYPPKQYSQVESYGWYTGNVAVGMLLPQRAFLLGMTLAVWAMAGLIYVLLKEKPVEKRDRLILLICGILAGLLPIIHAHSFIVTVIVTGLLCLVLYKKWRTWFYYAIPAGLISITLYLTFVSGGIQNQNFMQWLPGWNARGGLLDWITMWLKFWGVMIPVAIFGGVLIRKQPLVVKTFFLSFFIIFALGNLILFQPTHWDNSKLFLWAYFGFSGLAAAVLVWSWEKGGKRISRLDATLLAILLMFTGALELIRLQRVDRNQLQLTSTEDVRLGEEIRQKAGPLEIFLTAPIHNHPVTVWGVRPILMGYPEWVRNYGFLYQQRQQDVAVMFQGGIVAEELLRQYHVSYVAIGPSERHDLRVNEAYFAKNYPVAFRNQNYRIYDVRSLLNQTRTPSL